MKRLVFLSILFFSFTSLLFLSCNSQNPERGAESALRLKATPSVAIAPVIDSTNFDISWSLSEELTTLLSQKIEKSHQFSCSSDNSENDLSFSQNPFGADISWVKKNFRSQEFVVFLELIQHELKTVKNNKKSMQGPLNLDMALRIRILDLRGKKPRIALQELIQNTYFIGQSPIDYNQTTWGSKQYLDTPLYQAHLELSEEAAKRISTYIRP